MAQRVDVPLSGRDAAMPGEALNLAEVGAVGNQLGAEGVAKEVRMGEATDPRIGRWPTWTRSSGRWMQWSAYK